MALHWKILIGLVAGVVVGALVSVLWTDATWESVGVGDAAAYMGGGQAAKDAAVEGGANADAGLVAGGVRFISDANAFVGDFFMRGLRFIAVPIVLFSLIVGGASLGDISKLGRVGGKTLGLYMGTTAVAIGLGLVLANVVGPGRGFSDEQIASLQAEGASKVTSSVEKAEAAPGMWEVVLDMLPANPAAALAQGEMLQVVVTGLLIGLGLTTLPKEKAKPVVAFADAVTDVIIKIVHWVLLIAPYAVFALMAKTVAAFGLDALAALIKYCVTMIAGLAVMVFGVYPLILRMFTPIKYGQFFKGILPAQLLAFSSSSSGATMPVTMQCCEENLGVSEEVTSFVVPLGATVNMDGTAMYQGVAAVFICQLLGVELTFMDNITILITATLASVGTAAVPSAGIIMLVIVLNQLELTGEQIVVGLGVILGVDRLLDMSRTVCNITGDSMVTCVVAAGEGAIAPPWDREPPDPGEAVVGEVSI